MSLLFHSVGTELIGGIQPQEGWSQALSDFPHAWQPGLSGARAPCGALPACWPQGRRTSSVAAQGSEACAPRAQGRAARPLMGQPGKAWRHFQFHTGKTSLRVSSQPRSQWPLSWSILDSRNGWCWTPTVCQTRPQCHVHKMLHTVPSSGQ